MRRRGTVSGAPLRYPEVRTNYFWAWLVGIVVVFLVGVGILVREWQRSQVVTGLSHRFNLVVASTRGQVDFVSFDPVSRQMFILPFPATLSIRSRSVGEYTVGSLYALGSYGGNGGEFVREKVQGFMLVPVSGYVVTSQAITNVPSALASQLTRAMFGSREPTSLSWLDVVDLRLRMFTYGTRQANVDDLVRAGVLESTGGSYVYHADRLQQYVGTRLFDWNVGQAGVTVAVLNASGVDGLGSDVADFLGNVGYDVVMVRTAATVVPTTVLTIGAHTAPIDGAVANVESLFHFNTLKVGDVESYRANIVVTVGQDATNLF